MVFGISEFQESFGLARGTWGNGRPPGAFLKSLKCIRMDFEINTRSCSLKFNKVDVQTLVPVLPKKTRAKNIQTRSSHPDRHHLQRITSKINFQIKAQINFTDSQSI